jgi:hypothetical protein
VVNALCQQILCTIDNNYLMALEHWDLGYMVFPCERLVYLKETYDDITPIKIEKNRATLSILWNPKKPTLPTTSHVELPSRVRMYYCWSHGLSKNSPHTSPTCNFKKDSHVDTATADILQGGSNVIGTDPRNHCECPPHLAHPLGAPAGP